MNLYRGLSVMLLTFLIVFATTSAFAAVPLVTSYQGRLLDAGDQPLTGSYTMIFQIYDVPTGGIPLWTEDHVGVSVTDGLFTVALGATVPLSTDLLTGGGGSVRYLQIQIAGQPAISPRTRLSAAPYSVASGSVSGDIQTSPGRVVAGDLDGDGFLDISSSSDQSELHIARKRPGKVKYSNIALRVMPDSLSDYRDTDSDDDGVPESEFLQRLTPTTSSMAIKTKGTGASNAKTASLSAISSIPFAGGALASLACTVDNDGDGLEDNSVSSSADATSARLAINSKGTSAKREIKASTDSDSATILMTADVDGDGVPDRVHAIHLGPSKGGQRTSFFDVSGEKTIDEDCDVTGSRLAIKTKGTSAKREIRHNTDSLIAESSVAADLDGDGLEDLVVSSSTDATSAKHAINTKGTGAQGGKSASITVQATPGGSASSVLDIDDDGDSAPEGEISQTVTPTTSSMAIKTKGTGAEANKTASLTVTGSPGGNVSSIAVADTDGDGTNDEEISQIITPTTSGVAIKTKGTGAEANRTVIITGLTALGTSSHRCAIDDDGDSVPESEVSQIVTPTTSSVAIKTKGTGADPNRSASLVCATDIDGDGTFDRSVSTTADSATAGIAIDEPGVQVAMGMRKGWDGTIKGRFTVEESATRMIELNSDGDGYFAAKVGIGVDVPTHRIDVSGGAYCDGTNWVNASDVNSKENFQPVDGSELLDQIEQLAITRWNYKGNNQAEHIGPTAQDFKAAFGVGADDKSISTIDPSGIALAAIKALRIEAKNKTQQLNDLQNKVQQLEALVEKLLSEKK
jgi:hypothetical protein